MVSMHINEIFYCLCNSMHYITNSYGDTEIMFGALNLINTIPIISQS